MKLAIIECVNGNYVVRAEGIASVEAAKTQYHGRAQNLWNAPDVLTAYIAIVDEQLDVVEGMKEYIHHEPAPEPEVDSTEEWVKVFRLEKLNSSPKVVQKTYRLKNELKFFEALADHWFSVKGNIYLSTPGWVAPASKSYVDELITAPAGAERIYINRTYTDTVADSYRIRPIKQYAEDISNPVNEGMTIVNMGDSIFGNFRATGGPNESISHMVAEHTRATVHNCAFGGTHAKTMGGTARAPMDFQSLVTAIISGVWTDQEAYATAQGAAYLARVQALEAIDFSAVDVVTVSYGTNDFSSQVTPTDYETALTDGITRLQTAFPNLLCVICTPIIRFKHTDDPDSDPESDNGTGSGTGDVVSSDTYTSSSGYRLPEYAAKAEDVGKAMHCPVCENYWTLGINLYNYSTFMGGMAAADLVHPNAKGRRLIANHLIDTLARLWLKGRLGFRFRLTETGKVLMLIDPKNVKRERRKLRRLVSKSKAGFLPREKVDESYAAWLCGRCRLKGARDETH